MINLRLYSMESETMTDRDCPTVDTNTSDGFEERTVAPEGQSMPPSGPESQDSAASAASSSSDTKDVTRISIIYDVT